MVTTGIKSLIIFTRFSEHREKFSRSTYDKHLRYSVRTRNWELATFFHDSRCSGRRKTIFFKPIVVCILSDGRALIQNDERLNCPAHRDQAAG